MKLFGLFLILVLGETAIAKPSERRTNSNSQASVQQFGGLNANEQSRVQQSEQLRRYYGGSKRRSNENAQLKIQQFGNNNSNRQDNVQQYSQLRRSATSLQDNIQRRYYPCDYDYYDDCYNYGRYPGRYPVDPVGELTNSKNCLS